MFSAEKHPVLRIVCPNRSNPIVATLSKRFYDVDYDRRNELVKNKKKRKRKKKREEIVNEEPINEPRMHVAFLRKIFLCPNLHKYIRSRVYVLVTALIRACVY